MTVLALSANDDGSTSVNAARLALELWDYSPTLAGQLIALRITGRTLWMIYKDFCNESLEQLAASEEFQLCRYRDLVSAPDYAGASSSASI